MYSEQSNARAWKIGFAMNSPCHIQSALSVKYIFTCALLVEVCLCVMQSLPESKNVFDSRCFQNRQDIDVGSNEQVLDDMIPAELAQIDQLKNKK